MSGAAREGEHGGRLTVQGTTVTAAEMTKGIKRRAVGVFGDA